MTADQWAGLVVMHAALLLAVVGELLATRRR